jgi:type I restriction-modification system DNA methylase subunit
MAETGHNVIYNVTTPKEFSDVFEREYAAVYPYVRLEKLDEMASQFGVNYLVASKKHLVTQGFSQWTPSSQWQEVDVGEPIYRVFQRIPNP